MADAPPSVASLLKQHRENLGLSIREAARRASVYAKVSEGTWRRYEQPHAVVTRDDMKLAAMAAALSISAEDLTAAGRPDAASALQALMSRVASQPEVAGVPDGLSGHEGWADLMTQILAGFADIDAANVSAPVKAQLRQELISGLVRDAVERRRHMRVLRDINSGSGT